MAEGWQLLLSLGAVAGLVFTVRALRLGSESIFPNEAAVGLAAGRVADDFEPAEIAIDRHGRAALLRGRDGRAMVLKAHGAHAAGRVLGRPIRAWTDGATLVIDPADRRFGVVRLDLPDADRWKAWLDRLSCDSHA